MVELPDFAATPWLGDPELRAILELLDGAQNRSRVVGGLVRDTILGRPFKATDIDIATELAPEEVVRRAAAAGIAAHPTGIAHGTVTLRRGGVVAEVTTLREDIATDGRHAEVRFGTDWHRDAARRDFTLNALYVGLDGALFDPVGGLDDCLAGRVRFIGDAERRIEEDRLRVYRFFRFSASHGEQRFDADGLAACRRAAGTLDRLSAERVGAEMGRMLALPRIAETLSAMAAVGVLSLGGRVLAQLAEYERRSMAPTRQARMALLAGERSIERLQADWRLSNAEIAAVEDIVLACRLLAEDRLHEAAFRYPDALGDAADLVAVIEDWPVEGTVSLMDEINGLFVPEFPVSGADLIGIGLAPGPELGQRLRALEAAWIDSGFTLTRDELLARAG